MDLKQIGVPTGLWETDPPPGTATTPMAALRKRDGSQLLIPLRTNTLAAAALIRHNGSETLANRLVRRVAWLGARTGLARPLLRPRIRVAIEGSKHEGPSLHEYLADLLGMNAVEFSVTFGPPRPNQKPVVRVMTATGETVAFAKIGWNELTTRLVEHEVTFLRSPVARAFRRVEVPRVLHLDWWRSHRLALFTPLLGIGSRLEPSPDAFADVALAEGQFRQPLVTSPYLQSRHLLVTALPVDDRSLGSRLLDIVERKWASLDLTFGRWHGDWTPWNMARSPRGSLILWDWERTEEGVPLGLDAINCVLQPLLRRQVRQPLMVLAETQRRSRVVLAALGLDESAQEATLHLYILEMLLRHTGVTQVAVRRTTALATALVDRG